MKNSLLKQTFMYTFILLYSILYYHVQLNAWCNAQVPGNILAQFRAGLCRHLHIHIADPDGDFRSTAIGRSLSPQPTKAPWSFVTDDSRRRKYKSGFLRIEWWSPIHRLPGSGYGTLCCGREGEKNPCRVTRVVGKPTRAGVLKNNQI